MSKFTIRAYHSQIGGFDDFNKKFTDQINAEIEANFIFKQDANSVDGPIFDCVVVMNDSLEVVYEVEV